MEPTNHLRWKRNQREEVKPHLFFFEKKIQYTSYTLQQFWKWDTEYRDGEEFDSCEVDEVDGEIGEWRELTVKT